MNASSAGALHDDVAPRPVQPQGLLASAIVAVVVGMETFIVQPGFLQGLVQYRQLTEQQAGYIASAEMFGVAGMTILLAFIATKINWRRWGFAAAVLLAASNLASTQAISVESMCATRFIAGIGSGLLISWGYAAIGMTGNPDRNFGLLIMTVLVYGALGLWAMPVTYHAIGFNGVLIVLALLAATSMIMIRFLPARIAAVAAAGHAAADLGSLRRAMALGSVLTFFLGQGAIWAYLFLIGTAGGVPEQAVANGLTVAQLAGVAGALAAATLATRIGHAGMLSLSIILGVAPLFILIGTFSANGYAIAVIVFNFSANVLTPMLMALIAHFDRTGRLVTNAIALQMLGLAAGPAIAAAVMHESDYRNPILLCAALLTTCLALMLPPVLFTFRRRT